MANRIVAVIFDFEGTLVDFQWRLAEAETQLREVFASLGYGTAGNYAQMWNAAVDAATGVATNGAAGEAAGHAVNQTAGQAAGHAVNQTAGQAAGQAVNQTAGQAAGQAVNQTAGQAVGEAVGEAVGQARNDAAIDPAGAGRGMASSQRRLASLHRTLGPIYDRWDADALTRWTPRPGAANLLRDLAARGLRTAMVSNIGRAALAEALVRFDFEGRLAPVVSRDDVHRLKPHAEGIRRVLAHWKTAPEEALFVGDSKADVLAARAAGVRVAIVRGGECDASEFDALAPDYLVSALDEVPALASASAARS